MKKVFAFVAATVLFAGIANAQLGINVGYAPQTYKSTTSTTLLGSTITNNDVMALNGFFAGVNYNINITGDLGVSLGANYRMNTGSETVSGIDYTYTQSLVDVPVLFNYGLKLTDELKLSVFLGPTVSFALAGNTHSKTTILSATVENDVDWYDSNSNRKKLDISGTVGVNVQYKGFRLFGGYNLGLLDLGQDGDNYTYDLKASNWFVGLGYSL